uniref:Uncharacterized protein n=1 Tax=Oryza punctata TaxID=4537 RepID=A0A0E0KEM4_ORYPU
MAAATNPPVAAPMKKLEEATGAEGDGGEAASPAAESAVESGADSTAPSTSNEGTSGARKKLDRNGLSLVMGRTANSKKMKRLHHEYGQLFVLFLVCHENVPHLVSSLRKGKQDKQCIGRQTIAGKAVEEEYTEMRQLHILL